VCVCVCVSVYMCVCVCVCVTCRLQNTFLPQGGKANMSSDDKADSPWS